VQERLGSTPLMRVLLPFLLVAACLLLLAGSALERPYVGVAARAAARCPSDMAYVPGGTFEAGATADEVGLPDYQPDIVRDPRPRGRFETAEYCIDRFEFPGEGRRPLADVTWVQARVSCELGGKRLCSEDEWVKACAGPLGTLFPYGDVQTPGLCHADVFEEGRYELVVPAGSVATCRSPYGTFDQEGNVSEWVEGRRAADSTDRWVLGGTMWAGVYGRGCQARHAHPQVAPVSGDDGFRCCVDPR
jgi:eukaryotic-like serine/threonine-protein kinase